LFVFLEVHRPWRKVKVTNSRAAIDFAACMRELAWALGCEGIVSKRLGYPHRSGRVKHCARSSTRRRRR
jgi:hypothetical protein